MISYVKGIVIVIFTAALILISPTQKKLSVNKRFSKITVTVTMPPSPTSTYIPTPTQTTISSMMSQNITLVKFNCSGIFRYCDSEIAPTITEKYPCKCQSIPTPLPCLNNGSKLEKINCQIQQSNYSKKLILGCPMEALMSGIQTPMNGLIRERCYPEVK